MCEILISSFSCRLFPIYYDFKIPQFDDEYYFQIGPIDMVAICHCIHKLVLLDNNEQQKLS